MANPHLATTLATFEAQVHRTKNRLVAIPATVQRSLKLARRQNNHIIYYSIRPKGRGRWNHHLAYLTYDNEFAIPADVTHIAPGDAVEVKIHRVTPDANALRTSATSRTPGSMLMALGAEAGDDDREDGSQNIDGYLYGSGGRGTGNSA